MTELLVSQLIQQPGEHQVFILNCGDLTTADNWNQSINQLECQTNPEHLFPIVIDRFRVQTSLDSSLSRLVSRIKDKVSQSIHRFNQTHQVSRQLPQRRYTSNQIDQHYQYFFSLPDYQLIIRLNQLASQLNWSNLLLWSIINHQPKLVDIMAQYTNLRRPLANNLPPLHIAVLSGQLETIENLVNLFPPDQAYQMINQLTPDQSSALHYSVRHNQLDITKYLLNHQADVNERDSFGGKTPLLYAIINGNLDLIQLLIHHGADLHLEFLVQIDDELVEYSYSELVTHVYHHYDDSETKSQILDLLSQSIDS